MGAGAPAIRRLDTLFVTANLNAGGAQRSLVNLACAIAGRHRLAVAVCGESTHDAFARELHAHRIEAFRPAGSSDAFALAESLLIHAAGCRALCFWNVDARVKLLVAKFAPAGLRIVDVSPGGYACGEMDAAAAFAGSVATCADSYYARLDALVLKYRAASHPACRRVEIVANGVASLAASPTAAAPRYLVSGRIAPSKRLEVIVAAFARVRQARADAELHFFGRVEERHRAYAASLEVAAPGVRLRGDSFEHAHFREPWTAAVVLGTHQGSPNAVLEAMAAGVAVIANDSGGTRESVMHGATGWLLAEDADAGALAGAMLEAARDPARTADLGARGRERVRAHNTFEEMARGYLAILAPETPGAHEKMAGWIRPPELLPTSASPASSP
jgi:glycosyltransferase involved in cell wall biosynthesis